jgi:hypothetical protein
MNSLSISERVKIGKSWEDRIRIYLNNNGYNLHESTFYEDCREKTDCWTVAKSGKPLRCAIKVRLNSKEELESSKTDILSSLFDPFYGFDSPDNIVGRDMKYEYFMYVSVIKGMIRVVNGKTVHKINNAMWNEFLESNILTNIKPFGYGAKLVLSSKIYKKCQIWLHYDAKSRKPKLLSFIDPKVLIEGKEIKFHKFIEE